MSAYRGSLVLSSTHHVSEATSLSSDPGVSKAREPPGNRRRTPMNTRALRSGHRNVMSRRTMPRYFFDLIDGKDTLDHVGTELADHAAIDDLTLKTLADMVRDRIASLHQAPTIVTVRDESGAAVYRATLSLRVERIDKPMHIVEPVP